MYVHYAFTTTIRDDRSLSIYGVKVDIRVKIGIKRQIIFGYNCLSCQIPSLRKFHPYIIIALFTILYISQGCR